MTATPKTVFVPGFISATQARKAGEKAFARANGMPAKEGRHFYLVQNEHRRWHFEEGPGPKK